MYRGRFAPTISGPLHFGSLITAVASYLDARAQRGRWLLHIDDLDQLRVPIGAESQILHTLERHGLNWDDEPLRQTEQLDRYFQAVVKLKQMGHLFYCTCTRKDRLIGQPYAGKCRGRMEPPIEPHALRIRTYSAANGFKDRVQGEYRKSLAQVGGDFVIYRKDNMAAYPLTAVVDDATSRISDVVRGADLLENTISQIYLGELLQLPKPTYAHLPVLNERTGVKLSKRHAGLAVDDEQSRFNLRSTLQLLGMEPPNHYKTRDLLAWGVDVWDMNQVPKCDGYKEFISL